jgi:PilZ domain
MDRASFCSVLLTLSVHVRFPVTWLAQIACINITAFNPEGRWRKSNFLQLMGQRCEPRKQIRVPVRIFGTDAQGRTFSENVFTADVSRHGARLTGVNAEIKVGELIGLTYSGNRSRFSVKWSGRPGTERQGELGLENMTPEKALWDVPLPEPAVDEQPAGSKGSERRKHPRLRSTNSIELRAEGQSAPIWGKASDLSVGGCFVEMPIPLKQGTLLKVGLWIEQDKLWINGKVANSRPGFGIGIEFIRVSAQDSEKVVQFLRSIRGGPR